MPETLLPIVFTASSSSFWRRPVMKTYAPSLIKSFAVANPIPSVPPVMTATLPSSLLGSVFPCSCRVLMGVEPLPNIRDGILVERLVKSMRYVGDMRCCQDVVQRPEGVRRRQRLNVEHIDRRAGDLIVLQRADQSLLVDDWPARRIDQPGRWLHSLQLRGPYQAARTAAQHQMDRHDVSPLEQLVLGNQNCARGFGGLGRHVLAPGNQIHSKSAPDPRDLCSNVPKSQNAQGLSTQIRAHCLLPAAGSDGVALRHDVSRGGQDRRPGKFDRWVRPIPRVNHCDPMLACGDEIDCRVSRSGRGNELEIGKALNDVAGQRGPLAHNANDIKKQQPLNHGVRIGEVVLKYGDVRSIAEHRPIGALKRHILVIVQNSDLVLLHWYPSRTDSSKAIRL